MGYLKIFVYSECSCPCPVRALGKVSRKQRQTEKEREPLRPALLSGTDRPIWGGGRERKHANRPDPLLRPSLYLCIESLADFIKIFGTGSPLVILLVCFRLGNRTDYNCEFLAGSVEFVPLLLRHGAAACFHDGLPSGFVFDRGSPARYPRVAVLVYPGEDFHRVVVDSRGSRV